MVNRLNSSPCRPIRRQDETAVGEGAPSLPFDYAG